MKNCQRVNNWVSKAEKTTGVQVTQCQLFRVSSELDHRSLGHRGMFAKKFATTCALLEERQGVMKQWKETFAGLRYSSVKLFNIKTEQFRFCY